MKINHESIESESCKNVRGVIKNLCHHKGALCGPPILAVGCSNTVSLYDAGSLMVVWVCCGQRMLKEASMALRLEGCIQRCQKELNKPTAALRTCLYGVDLFRAVQRRKPKNTGPSALAEGELLQAFKHGNLQDAWNCMEQ